MEMCDNCAYNQQVLDRIKNEIPDPDLTIELADMFKVFGDNTRIRILWALFDKELCLNRHGLSNRAATVKTRSIRLTTTTLRRL